MTHLLVTLADVASDALPAGGVGAGAGILGYVVAALVREQMGGRKVSPQMQRRSDDYWEERSRQQQEAARRQEETLKEHGQVLGEIRDGIRELVIVFRQGRAAGIGK